MADQPANTSFSVVIVSPDEVVLETKATKMMVPGKIQEVAILPDHTPLYTQVIKGEIVVTLLDGAEKKVPIENGIMRVKQNKVSIILGFDS